METALVVHCFDGDRAEVDERRVLISSSFFHLQGIETFIVLTRGKLNDRIVRAIGLNQDAPFLVSAAGTSDKLTDQVERFFVGGVGGKAKRTVGIQHRRQRDVRKIMALGDDLGSDEDVAFAQGEGFQYFVPPFVSRDIGIQSQDLCLWEKGDEILIGPFRPISQRKEIFSAAWTDMFACHNSISAMVTTQFVVFFVVVQRDSAIGADGDGVAIATEKHRGIATAVYQYHRLFSSCERLFEFFKECL